MWILPEPWAQLVVVPPVFLKGVCKLHKGVLSVKSLAPNFLVKDDLSTVQEIACYLTACLSHPVLRV